MNNYFCELSKNIWEDALRVEYLKNKNLSVYTVVDGIVIPPQKGDAFQPDGPIFGWGGVADSIGNPIELSLQKAQGMRNRVEGKKINIDDISQSDDSTVIYLNFFIKQWGHYLLDVIGRLWYAIKEDINTKIVYTCFKDENCTIDGNYLELLELLGIQRDRMICVNAPTRFRKVIIPESAIYPGSYYTAEYKELFDEIVGRCVTEANITPEKNIYCSRALLPNNGKEMGEKRIESIFIQNNFTSIHMEKMSLRNQIIAINSAKMIAMVNGSLAHNLLFLRHDCPVIIINKTYRVNAHQVMINQISCVNAVYVDAYVAPMPVLYGMGPFIMSVTDEFKLFAKKMNIKIPSSYVNYALSHKEKVMYYVKWILTYKKFILKGKAIEEGGYDIPYRTIRKYYKNNELKKDNE